jgi:hypothetical protein
LLQWQPHGELSGDKQRAIARGLLKPCALVLANVYAKLGIRGRTQLIAMYAPGQPDIGDGSASPQ